MWGVNTARSQHRLRTAGWVVVVVVVAVAPARLYWNVIWSYPVQDIRSHYLGSYVRSHRRAKFKPQSEIDSSCHTGRWNVLTAENQKKKEDRNQPPYILLARVQQGCEISKYFTEKLIPPPSSSPPWRLTLLTPSAVLPRLLHCQRIITVKW